MNATLKAAFDEMRRTELVLDDMDYITNSLRLQKAMAAAAEFNRQLDDLYDDATKTRKGMA